jgi:hypothetical protein
MAAMLPRSEVLRMGLGARGGRCASRRTDNGRGIARDFARATAVLACALIPQAFGDGMRSCLHLTLPAPLRRKTTTPDATPLATVQEMEILAAC